MHKRSSIVVGTILILVGILFLLVNFFPGLAAGLDISLHWPLIIVAVGGLLILSAFLGTPTLAIPGSIVTGIGGILYVQNLTGTWDRLAYVWALIPGFVGLGLLLAGLLGHRRRESWRGGGRLMVTSCVMFLIFGAFFTGLGGLGKYWLVLLIGVGVWMLLPTRKRRRSGSQEKSV